MDISLICLKRGFNFENILLSLSLSLSLSRGKFRKGNVISLWSTALCELSIVIVVSRSSK